MITRRRRTAGRGTAARRQARALRPASRRTAARAVPAQDWTPFWAAAAATLMTVGHYLAYGYW